jgi:hypothetical protein
MGRLAVLYILNFIDCLTSVWNLFTWESALNNNIIENTGNREDRRGRGSKEWVS